MHRSIHIQRAGLYREMIEGPTGVQVGEFFDAENIDETVVTESFSRRAAKFPNATFNWLLLRIGVYGADPAHLAVWTFPTYKDMDTFLPDQNVATGVTI